MIDTDANLVYTSNGGWISASEGNGGYDDQYAEHCEQEPERVATIAHSGFVTLELVCGQT